MKAKTTYTPHAGPIDLDNLDELFAGRRALFGGFSMKKDDDEDEVDDPADDDDDDSADDDDDDGEDYKPPTKEEWQKTQAALKKANAEAKKRRLKAREAADKDDKDDAGKGDEDAAARREHETEAKWKNRVVKMAARAALATAGVENPARLTGLIDVTELDVDDDGEVDGLDDEVDRLKEEYPELFKAKRGARIETGDRSNGATTKKPLSASERQARAILGRK